MLTATFVPELAVRSPTPWRTRSVWAPRGCTTVFVTLMDFWALFFSSINGRGGWAHHLFVLRPPGHFLPGRSSRESETGRTPHCRMVRRCAPSPTSNALTAPQPPTANNDPGRRKSFSTDQAVEFPPPATPCFSTKEHQHLVCCAASNERWEHQNSP